MLAVNSPRSIQPNWRLPSGVRVSNACSARNGETEEPQPEARSNFSRRSRMALSVKVSVRIAVVEDMGP